MLTLLYGLRVCDNQQGIVWKIWCDNVIYLCVYAHLRYSQYIVNIVNIV